VSEYSRDSFKLVSESRDWLRRAQSSLFLFDFSTRDLGGTVGDGASASHSPLKTGWTLYWLGKVLRQRISSLRARELNDLDPEAAKAEDGWME
jgi:hypothetical protein